MKTRLTVICIYAPVRMLLYHSVMVTLTFDLDRVTIITRMVE